MLRDGATNAHRSPFYDLIKYAAAPALTLGRSINDF
jgi:hypothetical protein